MRALNLGLPKGEFGFRARLEKDSKIGLIHKELNYQKL
jgi:hypothetical protein